MKTLVHVIGAFSAGLGILGLLIYGVSAADELSAGQMPQADAIGGLIGAAVMITLGYLATRWAKRQAT